MSATARDLTPASALPIAYFTFAHLALLSGLGVLIVHPDVPGAYFYHPKMVALVHLVTLAWISGSILGAFYIVAPLALRMGMPAGRTDWIACGAFVVGATGMSLHLWLGDYDGLVPDAALATAAITWVGLRAWLGLPKAPVPWPVRLHVALAFVNIVLAAGLGILVALDRTHGLRVSPLAATFAHLHLAAVGWAGMMVVGLAYRLIPMILPAAMPTGAGLATSAVCLEVGVVLVAAALLTDAAWLPLAALVIVAGFISFAVKMRRTVAHRLPRPPALPRRDWSAWQAHGALLWLAISIVLGQSLALGFGGASRVRLQWVYGVAGLVGFLAQIVVGMQGRLVPLYAWYRAFSANGGRPPSRAANDLPSSVFARPLCLLWAVGVPLLAWGLASGATTMIRAAATILGAGVVLGLAYLRYLLREARRS